MIDFTDKSPNPDEVPPAAFRRHAPVTASHENRESPMPGPESGRLSRTMINFWLDATLLVVLMSLGVTAVIVQFIFPPGIAARGWTLWGMSYGKWCSIQFAELSLLGVGVLVHVMLHWTWVCSVVTRRIFRLREIPDDGIRTVYGVGFLIVLLLLSAACVVAAMLSIQDPGV